MEFVPQVPQESISTGISFRSPPRAASLRSCSIMQYHAIGVLLGPPSQRRGAVVGRARVDGDYIRLYAPPKLPIGIKTLHVFTCPSPCDAPRFGDARRACLGENIEQDKAINQMYNTHLFHNT